MRSKKWSGTVGVLAFFCILVTWNARGSRDIIAAQRRTPITMTRMYTGTDGETHAEDVEIKLTPRADRIGSERSERVNVTGLPFQRTIPGYFQDWHPVSQRQYMITLSGHREIEIAGGRKIALEPGKIVLAEDSSGKGHVVRGIGKDEAVSLIIPLAK